MGIRTVRRQRPSAAAVCRGAVGVTAAASLAACGASAVPVSLPHKESAGAAVSVSPSPSPTSQRQAVVEAYLAFWSASNRAERAGNESGARTILTPYVYSSYISYMISGMRSAWGKHEVSWGASVEHIESVTLATIRQGEQTAVVKDCQDASHEGLASAVTGALVPGSLGSAHQQLYASLSLIGGRWLIEQVTIIGNTCAS